MTIKMERTMFSTFECRIGDLRASMFRLALASCVMLATSGGSSAHGQSSADPVLPGPSEPAVLAGLILIVRVVGGADRQSVAGARIFLRNENGNVVSEGRTNRIGVAMVENVPPMRMRIQVAANNEWVAAGKVVDVSALDYPPTVEFVLQAVTAPGIEQRVN